EKTPPVSPTSLDVDFENRISFSLPEPAEVRIEVWDAAGRRVQTLFEGQSSAGTHTINWDVSGLPSGAYFITLRTKAITRTAKAVVIQ
ncbi:MAG: FlgD immunoglobulin-like domain containing protein, partial [candidate division WOR-3 bacterium]|nr:FlgD immunoglobulin-like domain containing protein [candidate division WOR-3 bacterium]